MKIVLIILVLIANIIGILIGYQLDQKFKEIEYELDTLRDEVRNGEKHDQFTC